MREGILFLQVFDKVSPGVVNWKKVNMNTVGIHKRIENCNYAVELGKDLKLSLVGIAGKDFVDGNLKMGLALLNQLMQHHIMSKLKNISIGGKHFTEEALVNTVNEKVKTAGKTTKIRSFRDQSLKEGLFLVDVLFALRPNLVNYTLVTPGKTPEEKMQNAKYVISVARKAGCNIFVVPEDIVELKTKRIVCMVGEMIGALA